MMGRPFSPLPVSSFCVWFAACSLGGIAWLASDLAAQHAAPPAPIEPVVHADDGSAQRALRAMKVPSGWKRELFAAEPLLANPVALTVDRRGRVFVCETFRANRGVEDNRHHMDWLHDDLAAQSVADRLAYLKRRLGDRLVDYTRNDDRVRLLTDTDDDGRADRATVFADRFNTPVSGIGSSVLVLPHGGVLYACIPDLWRLEDADGDGQAEQRASWFHGFGNRFAFFGHDLHGLCFGPDCRIYFSIGDRGFNVETDRARIDRPDGTFTLHGKARVKSTESGAVLRCELDGSGLEIVANGLRNPQELAFDELGNLFTGDNNSDSGDKARWVYVVPYGDSGWRMAYQYLPDRGPFNREGIWRPYFVRQPGHIIPPVANVASGPSGLTYYPGTGFGRELDRTFLLADFRGVAGQSAIRAIQVQPDGAFFRLTRDEVMIRNVLATDLCFGPDSRLYISDWVHGWVGEGRGRIYCLSHVDKNEREAVRKVRTLLATGIFAASSKKLVSWLGHRDQRVRIAASMELLRRALSNDQAASIGSMLLETARRTASGRAARMHAMWTFMAIARRGRGKIRAPRNVLGDSPRSGPGENPRSRANIRAPRNVLQKLLGDDDPEVRRLAAEWVGDLHRTDVGVQAVVGALDAGSPRVQAAMALSLCRAGRALGARERSLLVVVIGDVLEANNDVDPVLRHACVMGLTGIASAQQIERLGFEGTGPVRRAAVVALRRLKSPAVARLAPDTYRTVDEDVARAIYDEPIPEALLQLARMTHYRGSDSVSRRALGANYRLGDAEAASRVAALIDSPACSAELRAEAWWMLEHWARPPSIDRVLGIWRPTPPRSATPAVRAIESRWDAWQADEDLQPRAALAAARLGMHCAIAVLWKIASRADHPAALRAEALETLSKQFPGRGLDLARTLLADKQPRVRNVARRVVLDRAPGEAMPLLVDAAGSGTVEERQQAFRLLGTIRHADAERILRNALRKMVQGAFPAELQLEALQAARNYVRTFGSSSLAEILASYDAARAEEPPARRHSELLAGGNAQRGKVVFFDDVRASCSRCHTIGGRGGQVGPDLSHVAKGKAREAILEAIIDPNRTIAQGFETIALFTTDGRVVTGIVRSEDDRRLVLIDADGKQTVVPRDTIEEHQPTTSSMPQDILKHLPPEKIRDLVEFLMQQR